MLIEIASHRFGPPDAATRSALEAVTDPARPDAIRDRLLTATDWADLLASPSAHGVARAD